MRILLTIIRQHINFAIFNTKNDKWESDNYMILFYQNEVMYKSGFSSYSFRYNIDFLAINKKITTKEALNIKHNAKVEIHYLDDDSTLENYFSLNYGDNAKYI